MAAAYREITLHYRLLDPGTPERGRYGPPENYDPGSPPEWELDSIEVDEVEGYLRYEDMTPRAWQWFESLAIDEITSDMQNVYDDLPESKRDE